MQLYPTRAAFHVALSGAALIAVGVAGRVPAVVAFGSAVILAVAIGRALARLGVARLRAAGFEMVWNTSRRVTRAAPGEEVELELELRNRGDETVRGIALRPVISSFLDARIVPDVVDLPAGSAVSLSMFVTPNRVGRWGVHGLALEVRGTPLGGEGLYEVPLVFANPHGVEVLPCALYTYLSSPRGGRARRVAPAGRPSQLPGEGDELRELREHAPGDPFKRIAWKASARRGTLLVRAMEREERDVVMLVLDASIELWAGSPGSAPLDFAVEELASVAARHLALGDSVGLSVVASRPRASILPSRAHGHLDKIIAALASSANAVDADRSELDETEVATRVAEHLRPLDPKGLADVRRNDLDALARRAESLRPRAPFVPRTPFAKTPREQIFRGYLAAFGVESAPRIDGERERTDATLVDALRGLVKQKPAPSIVHVWAPLPARGNDAATVLRSLARQRVEVRWSVPDFASGVGTEGAPKSAMITAVEEAVRIRAAAARTRAERTLAGLGVKTRRVRLSRKVGGEAA